MYILNCCINLCRNLCRNTNIPDSLHKLDCFSIEDVADVIIQGFSDYTDDNVCIAIKYLKDYLNNNYNSKFHGNAMISIIHFSDTWKTISSDGKYLTCGQIDENNICYSRWLLRIKGNNIHFVDKLNVNNEIPSSNIIRISS
jgi:hypothetical protein